MILAIKFTRPIKDLLFINILRVKKRITVKIKILDIFIIVPIKE